MFPDRYSFPARSASASMLQGSATFGWSKTGERSTFSVIYSPSYLQEFHLSNYHSFNQALSLAATRKLNSKLTLGHFFSGPRGGFQ